MRSGVRWCCCINSITSCKSLHHRWKSNTVPNPSSLNIRKNKRTCFQLNLGSLCMPRMHVFQMLPDGQTNYRPEPLHKSDTILLAILDNEMIKWCTNQGVHCLTHTPYSMPSLWAILHAGHLSFPRTSQQNPSSISSHELYGCLLCLLHTGLTHSYRYTQVKRFNYWIL